MVLRQIVDQEVVRQIDYLRVTSEATIDEYYLGEFSISDMGIINFDGESIFD